MANAAKALVMHSCLALSACDLAGSGGVDSNLDCAAMVSAAQVLVRNGSVEKDPVLAKRWPVVLMSYLAAHAIPKRIEEAEAFAQMNARRATLIEQHPPTEIFSRARRCVERSVH